MVPRDALTAPEAKRVLRSEARQRRARRSPADRAQHGRALAAATHSALDRATTVAAFVGVGDEPETLPLLEALRTRGVHVLLPVTLPDLDLDWARYEGEESLAPARFGLLEPQGDRLGRDAVATADVVLVPAFAVDHQGQRLGQGGGCYDRALTRVPPTTSVLAVVFPDEVVDTPLPQEPHDRPVTGPLLPAP
ncbi:MAG TPA: 5-formyltetrahydrofolate cyclo-ligase [Actinomycetes bacterium]|nr:5-formyltetrahydrofolate cyclo-ligase [Actinomycetes bacterium]